MIPVLAFIVLTGHRQPGAMDVWRKLDAKGRACASCHSPDGLELRAFDFGREDIVRRASNHLAKPDQLKILEFLSAPSSLKLDPMTSRPMQPGKVVLPGATPALRDLAFGKELMRLAPALATPIKNQFDAMMLRNQLLAIDLRSLKIGIEMNRLSEDKFHGSEHATIAQWIPDLPVVKGEAIYPFEDRYLADPTPETLRALDEAVLAANPIKGGLADLSLNKFRALLILNYRLRSGDTSRLVLGKGVRANPMWIVGDLARQYSGTNPAMMGTPADVAAAKTLDWSKQLKAMRLPWFWLGWMEDPALSRSGLFPETKTGHYFVSQLMYDGPYPIHAAFVAAKRMVELAYGPDQWTSAIPRHPEIQFSALAVSHLLQAAEPADPNQRHLYRQIIANTFRMMAVLVAEDARRTGAAIHPESQMGQAAYVADYLKLDASGVISVLAKARSEVAKPRGGVQ